MNNEKELCFGYDREVLAAAFRVVQNKKHWKLPVSATIAESEFAVTSAAVAFFTGSNLEVVKTLAGGRVRVYAVGYYNAIGA